MSKNMLCDQIADLRSQLLAAKQENERLSRICERGDEAGKAILVRADAAEAGIVKANAERDAAARALAEALAKLEALTKENETIKSWADATIEAYGEKVDKAAKERDAALSRATTTAKVLGEVLAWEVLMPTENNLSYRVVRVEDNLPADLRDRAVSFAQGKGECPECTRLVLLIHKACMCLSHRYDDDQWYPGMALLVSELEKHPELPGACVPTEEERRIVSTVRGMRRSVVEECIGAVDDLFKRCSRRSHEEVVAALRARLVKDDAR